MPLLSWESIDAIKQSATFSRRFCFTCIVTLRIFHAWTSAHSLVDNQKAGQERKWLLTNPSLLKPRVFSLASWRVVMRLPWEVKTVIAKLWDSKIIGLLIGFWRSLNHLNHYLITNFSLAVFSPSEQGRADVVPCESKCRERRKLWHLLNTRVFSPAPSFYQIGSR